MRAAFLPLVFATLWAASCCSAPPASGGDAVIVVHGLGRSPASMAILSSRLEDAGFRVIRFGYPSREEPIEDLVERLAAEVRSSCCGEEEDVHFVTHSMGSVLVRSYLSQGIEAHRGRVVMLSPPSRGSEIVDAFAESGLLRKLLGPAAFQLGTGSEGIASELGPVRFELGIITGDRSLSPLGSWLIPGPDDGKVGVGRAEVEGARAFQVIHATHTFIMNRRDVADDVVYFLQHGQFLE